MMFLTYPGVGLFQKSLDRRRLLRDSRLEKGIEGHAVRDRYEALLLKPSSVFLQTICQILYSKNQPC